VSGHGFGHFTRSEAVLARLASTFAIHVRTSERALALARRAPWAESVTETDVGPGVAQRGPLETDLDATARALEAHLGRFDALAASEAAALRALAPAGVYADVPPVAFEAAALARVPSAGLANFSWSWIYEGLAPCARFAPRLKAAEARAGSFLALPFAGGLDHFPRREALPLVVREPTRTREEARALLPLSPGERRPVVLLSFGGFGEAFDLGEAARRNEGFVFVAFAPSRVAAENLVVLPHDHAFPHQDLVLGADAILGKPGYGTVAEAIFARRPFVSTPRGDFPEYPILLAGIEANLPSARLTLEELHEGRWSGALERALAAPVPPPRLAASGARVAAERIRELFLPRAPRSAP
jgi:hypothetical protein